MEIITLLKANIRRKKGSFISIVLLTIIIVTSATAIFSVRDNYNHATENAFETANAGFTTIYIRTDLLTDALLSSVEDNPFINDVNCYQSICSDGHKTIGDNIEIYDGNSYFITKMREGILLYNETADGFTENIPQLESGEIYLPFGLKSKLSCNIGDTINLPTINDTYQFTIKGFVQEPTNGAMVIGWKQVFVSDTDFDTIYTSCKQLETENVSVEFTIMQPNQTDDCILSGTKLQRQLNLETKIIDLAAGSLTREQSMRFTGIYIEVISSILLVFIGLLFVIVLIVMGHSISTEIEIDYVNFGILKSQGFTKWKIRTIIVIRYLLAELIGIVIGSILAFPLEKILSTIFMQITAILPYTGISIGKSILFTLLLLFLSTLLIFVKTRTIGSISPVKAMSGGKADIYFDSRIKMPIFKKGLSLSLALRQFTANKRRYVGTILIVSILTFFMVTINLLGNLLTSRTALETMGLEVTDLDIRYSDRSAEEFCDEIEALVYEHATVTKKFFNNSCYMSINGENIYCVYYKYPEFIGGILKGRAPLYDNEIIITDMVADTLEIQMGDEVTVSDNEKEATYLVSGIYQSMNDSGMAFSMSFDGAKKLGKTITPYLGFALEDPSQAAEIANILNQKYGDVIHAEEWSFEKSLGDDDTYSIAVNAMKAIIYSFSIIFALVVIRMVCSKCFSREKIDIGIYKSLGFTSNRLRLQFALRFFVVSLIGSVLGMVLSLAFSAKLIGAALSLIGVSQISTDYTFFTLLVPVSLVGLCFFLFAFMVSGKIKKIEIRELVTE